MRRPLIALVAAGGAALVLVAGAGSATAALPKTIQVVTFTPNAPFEFRRAGKLTGFDIQLVERIARTIGITRVQWRPQTTFSKVIPLVATDTYPMAAADITVTTAREQRIDFGTPYYTTQIGIVTRANSPIVGYGGLAGQTVGVVNGTTGQTAANNLPNSRVRSYPTFPALYKALLDAKIGAALNDYPQSQWYVQANARKFTMAGTIPGSGSAIALAFAPDQDALRVAFNRGLATLRSNGTLGKLVNTWIPSP
jgi:polar amino acid transport system substrate-binding protein